MRYLICSLAITLLFSASSFAQQKWDLRACIEYAKVNNISVKQTDVQAQITELQYKQSKLSQFPNATLNTSGSFNSGRNQDPTTYELITQSYLSAGIQLQSSADIFNWSSKQNTIAANKWELAAAKANIDKLKDDISLSVANAYLQILLAKEQLKIAGVQLQQSQAQLTNTKKLVAAGSLPELNAAEMEAQVARDSSTYITAEGSVAQNILALKSLMNIDAAAPFEIETPPVELIPVESIIDLQPEAVYALAVINLPQQRVNDFKLKAALKNTAAARGSMYPTFSAFGTLSSNSLNAKTPIYEQNIIGYRPTGLRADAGGGVFYDVQSPVITNGKKIGNLESDAFDSQISDNFRQSVGININIPIFNANNLRTNWERSKLNTKNLELQKEADNQKLKQDIYQAYNAATVALEKFNASKKTVETSQRTYDFAWKRYTVGMLSTIDLIINQNNLFRAKLEYILNQFDYVFKMKVLEFYKGQGLKL